MNVISGICQFHRDMTVKTIHDFKVEIEAELNKEHNKKHYIVHFRGKDRCYSYYTFECDSINKKISIENIEPIFRKYKHLIVRFEFYFYEKEIPDFCLNYNDGEIRVNGKTTFS